MTKRPKNMPNNAFSNNYCHISKLIISMIISTLLFSCASTPPSQTLPQSKVAVASVDHSNYRNYLNNEVEQVKSKLEQAQSLATNNQHEQAEQLAQQILVDVELIQIKTQRLSEQNEVKQIEESIANLHEELKWREPIQITPLNQ